METIELDVIKSKLYEKLKASGYGPVLKNYMAGSDFDEILQFLYDESTKDRKWTPGLKYLFKSFEECKYDDLKVIIVGQDPYPQLNVADGIAFSCSRKNKIELSLQYIYESISRTTGIPISNDPDLKRWANQGVLLLNAALTTQLYKPSSHMNIWKSFMTHLLDYVAINKPDTVFVFLGKIAKDFSDALPQNTIKLYASHPASAAYSSQTQWDCSDIWNKINQKLKQNGKQEIIFD